jgi:hypothetical protein
MEQLRSLESQGVNSLINRSFPKTNGLTKLNEKQYKNNANKTIFQNFTSRNHPANLQHNYKSSVETSPEDIDSPEDENLGNSETSSNSQTLERISQGSRTRTSFGSIDTANSLTAETNTSEVINNP